MVSVLSFHIAALGSILSFMLMPLQQETGDAPAELSAVVDELLNNLTSKFSAVSSEIFSKSWSFRMLIRLVQTVELAENMHSG